MTRTRFLAAIAVAALSMQLYPQHADTIKWVAIAVGAAYLGSVARRLYSRHYGDKRRLETQRRTDEEQFSRYERELAALRLKYAVNDGGLSDDAADAYANELAALHAEHRDMLARKFGFA